MRHKTKVKTRTFDTKSKPATTIYCGITTSTLHFFKLKHDNIIACFVESSYIASFFYENVKILISCSAFVEIESHSSALTFSNQPCERPFIAAE